jgi:osomolarity two-component system sensor histidine kinase NIK1
VRKRLKVLLAEDHVINQMLVTRLLETAGHEVKVVENGLLAVDAVTEGSFDVVLMDLQMPVMGGFEAIARIRAMADEKKRRVLSIALTAHAMKGDRERCLAAGFDEYLSKPVNPRTLAETMATCLDAAAEATVRMPPRA